MSESDADFFAARGFGQRLGFGERPALLVVDLIRAFTDPSWPLGSDLTEVLARTQELVQSAHDSGVTVFYSTVRYDDPEMRDAGVWGAKMTGAATLKAGTGGSDIDETLTVDERDVVFVKKYASCFFGTDLGSRLVSARVDTLIIAGATTSGCVRASAVDAVQNGFRPIIVREAVGDRSVSAHEQSLFDLDAKYGDVRSQDDVLDYLHGVGAKVGAAV